MTPELAKHGFLRQTASEDDGSGSMGRFVSEILFAWSIAASVYYQITHEGNLPDAGTLIAIGTFCMLPYTASKTASVVTRIKSGEGDAKPLEPTKQQP
jgi:hypothetical protein